MSASETGASGTTPTPPPGTVAHADEQLPIGAVSIIAFVALVVFALGVVWAARLQHNVVERVEQTRGLAAPADQVPAYGDPEIGIVDQQLYQVERRTLEMRRVQTERLSSYGWADRAQATIHLPVEEAMKRYVAEKSAQPAPETTPEPSEGEQQ